MLSVELQQLREFLAIPRDTEALIERYSDSAAAFVVLDPSNVSVYKQLYRAAKAKQRLKIRITTKAETPEAAAEPAAETDVAAEQKPTAVEAEPQPKAEPEPTPVVKSEPETVAEEKAAEATSAVEMEQPAWPHSKFEDRLADVARLTERLREVQLVAERHAQMNMQNNWSDSPVPDQKAPESVQPAAEAPAAPVPTVDVDQSRWFQNCVVPLAARPQFAICCNSCDKTIPNEHFHCSICDEGDFDLCQDCVDRGVTCHVADHWLIKRTVEGGCIKYSNTERLAPKRRSEETATKPVVDVAAPVAAPVPPPVPAPMLPYTQLADIPARGLAHPAYRPGAFNVRTCNCCVQGM